MNGAVIQCNRVRTKPMGGMKELSSACSHVKEEPFMRLWDPKLAVHVWREVGGTEVEAFGVHGSGVECITKVLEEGSTFPSKAFLDERVS